ncbi:restriction endonuclease subunit S, partial [Bacteroidales bacterium MSK.15.36]|nr:restriction endonuclease subunit S [Bacteroidales bacterium MSK.15.36]
LLDDLIESIFYDMFGDPVKNDKGWEVKKLGKITKFIDYRGKTPPIQDSGILLITAKNIGKKHFKEEPIEYISKELYKERMTRGFPKANDVLFVTEGATMGFVCRVPRNIEIFSVGQRVITLVCKDKLKEEYLHYFISDRGFQGEINRRSTGSSAKGIRASELKKIEVLLPPLPLQNQFAEKVQAIEKQKELL